MKPEPEDKPAKVESILRPIKDWASAPKLPDDHWIYKGGPQITSVGGLEPSVVPSPVKKSRSSTRKEESIAGILLAGRKASKALQRQRPATLEEMKAQGLRTRREPSDLGY